MEREHLDILEAMTTLRSMRRVKPDPIPDAVLHAILDATICAPNGNNRQEWAFLVVRDPAIKRQYQQWLYEVTLPWYHAERRLADAAAQDDARREEALARIRLLDSVLYLGEHIHEAPVWVLCCIRAEDSLYAGSSIYPAVQNLLLAARAFGIGTTLTTPNIGRDMAEINALFGVPEGVHIAAVIPMGYPRDRWGRPPRRPVEEVVYLDRYGAPFFQK